MKRSSVLTLKNVLWAAAGLVVLAVLLLFGNHSGAKTTEKAPSASSVVEVAPVEQTDNPIYQEWIGTLTGQVNAEVKAQVTGYLNNPRVAFISTRRWAPAGNEAAVSGTADAKGI